MHRRIGAFMFVGSLAMAGCGRNESTDALIRNLSSENAKDRVVAVRQLQNRREDAAIAVPALIESLNDKDVSVRLSDAIGLGYFGPEADSALPELENARSDKDRRVRDAAKRAISRISGHDEDENQKP